MEGGGEGRRMQLAGRNVCCPRDSWVAAACPRVPTSPIPILPIPLVPHAATAGPGSTRSSPAGGEAATPGPSPALTPGTGVPPVGSSRRGTGGPGQPFLPSPPN